MGLLSPSEERTDLFMCTSQVSRFIGVAVATRDDVCFHIGYVKTLTRVQIRTNVVGGVFWGTWSYPSGSDKGLITEGGETMTD